jgi:hypothetical protein
MNFLGEGVFLIVVERQGLDLAHSVEVVVDVFGTLDHEDLLAVLDFGLDDDLGVQVDDAVGPSNDFGVQLVLFLAAEGDVLDVHEVVPGVDDAYGDEDLSLVLVPILNL